MLLKSSNGRRTQESDKAFWGFHEAVRRNPSRMHLLKCISLRGFAKGLFIFHNPADQRNIVQLFRGRCKPSFLAKHNLFAPTKKRGEDEFFLELGIEERISSQNFKATESAF
jgi:hypothetical protein